MQTPTFDQFVHDIKGSVRHPYYRGYVHEKDIALYMCVVDTIDILALIRDLMIEVMSLEQQLTKVKYVSNRIESETAGGNQAHCSKCGEAIPTRKDHNE